MNPKLLNEISKSFNFMKSHWLSLSFIKISSTVEVIQNETRSLYRATNLLETQEKLLSFMTFRGSLDIGIVKFFPSLRNTHNMNELTMTMYSINMNILILPSNDNFAPSCQVRLLVVHRLGNT